MRPGLSKQQVLRRLRMRRTRNSASAISDLRHPTAWLQHSMLGRTSTAGAWVSSESSMGLAAYFACVRVIAEDIAKLPLRINRMLQPRGREVVRTHPAFKLLNRRPNPWMTAYTFRETVTQWAVGWGNGYAEIVRDNRGAAQELWPIHPSRVEVRVENGQLHYDIWTDDRDRGGERQRVRVPSRQVLHVRGIGDDLCGYSVANVGRESIGLAMAAQEFGSSFFGNDATLGNYVIPPDGIGEDQRRALQTNLDRIKDSQFKHLVLPPGVKVERGMVPPEDIQFLETRQFQVEEVARWFRMKLHKIEHLLRATFSNIEHQSIEYVVDTLMPWAVRWEQEVETKLLSVNPELEARHIFNALLRGDYATRTAGYATMRQNGILSANDVRELEDENPINVEGADDYHIQKNMQRLEDVGKEPEPPPQPAPMLREEEEPEEDDAEQEARVRAVVWDAAQRCERRRVKATEARASLPHRKFVAWANEWFSGHRAYVASAMAPIWTFMGRPAGLDRLLDEYQAKHIEGTVRAHRAGDLDALLARENEAAEDLTNRMMTLEESDGS